MRKRDLFSRSLLLLGLAPILAVVLIRVRQPARPGTVDTQPSTPVDVRATAQLTSTVSTTRIDLSKTEWKAFEDAPLSTLAEWQATQPEPPALRVEERYSSTALPSDASAGQVVCALVNPSVYDGISASLARWALDAESEGWSVVVYSASFPDPPSLRAHLGTITDLKGCLLIGDFPVPWYEINDKQFPMDVYYMDLDGVWHDADVDGAYDDQTGDVAPEIWIGRMTAGNLTFGPDEVSLLNNYFAKNHAYRAGGVVLPARALVYLDDDWEYAADNMGQQMALLFPDTTVISDPNTTRASDYGGRLTDYYAWIQMFAHSTAGQHNFSCQEGGEACGSAIYNDNIYDIDPHTFFYNLFACGAARFIEPDYLAGWYVFADSYGLMALGSTTSGSMVRGHDLFYGLLAQGKPLGEAYWEWFKVEGVPDRSWHYGLTMLGDPTLIVNTEDMPSEAVASVAVNGPITGDLGVAQSFTATVDPITATGPIMYTWQSSDKMPVTHKGGTEDTITLTWWNNPSPKAITVTARNLDGTVAQTHAITIEAPEAAITPSAISETLTLGSVVTRSLTISNAGPGNLVVNLAEADRSPTAGIGPDPFGYRYKDSKEADGPTYEWVEIAPSAGGSGTEITALSGMARSYFWPVPLPFSFDYYGKRYDQLAVNSNGTLRFRNRYMNWENLPIPSSRGYGAQTFVAHWHDFFIIDPGAVYYQELDSKFVIEFYQVSRLYGVHPGTWEVILFDNGNILFQYQDVEFGYYWGDYGLGAAVGIQGDAITGLEYSYRTTSLSNGLAICFAHPGQMPDCSVYRDVPWLFQEPGDATVSPGEQQSVELVFDACVPNVMQPGEYETTLVAISNDPGAGRIMVPVTMVVVSPTFGLALSPREDTRSGDPGTTLTYTLRLTNTGDAPDTFGVIRDRYAWPISVPETIGPLGPSSSRDLVVAVEVPPDALGGTSDTAVLVVASQGDSTLSITVTLTTVAQSIPSAIVSKQVSTSVVQAGQALTYTLRLTNTGNVDLHATITDVLPSPVTPSQVLTWIETIPALGGAWHQTVVVTVDVGYAGLLTNTVYATSEEGATATAIETCEVQVTPMLEVSKQASASLVQAGEQLTYALWLTNTGNVDLHVTVTDVLPSCLRPAGVLTWTETVPALGGVWQQVVPVAVDMDCAGAFTNVVQVTSEEGATGGCSETCVAIAGRRAYLPLVRRDR